MAAGMHRRGIFSEGVAGYRAESSTDSRDPDEATRHKPKQCMCEPSGSDSSATSVTNVTRQFKYVTETLPREMQLNDQPILHHHLTQIFGFGALLCFGVTHSPSPGQVSTFRGFGFSQLGLCTASSPWRVEGFLYRYPFSLCPCHPWPRPEPLRLPFPSPWQVG